MTLDRKIWLASALVGLTVSGYLALRPAPTVDAQKQANASANVDQFVLEASVDVLLRHEDRDLTKLRSGQTVHRGETLFATYENRLDHGVRLRIIEADSNDRLSLLREAALLPGLPTQALGEVTIQARLPGPMALLLLLCERGELATLPLRATADELRAMCPQCAVRAIPLVAAEARD